jgi:hypothetical protein
METQLTFKDLDPMAKAIIEEMEARPSSTASLRCMFKKHAVFDPKETKRLGYPVSREEIHAVIHVDPYTVVDAPVLICDPLQERTHISKHTIESENVHLDQTLIFKRQWDAFEKGLSQDNIGFRLNAFFINEPAKCTNYEYLNIFTVEQLASAPHATISKLPGGLEDQKKCIEYLERIRQSAPISEVRVEVEDLKAALEAEREKNEQLVSEFKVLSSELKTLMSNKKNKKGEE